jgi:ubiquitin-protein ligase
MERLRLEQMNRESDYCRAEPRDVLNGSEPEHYVVTFRCRGIVGLDGQRPVYGEFHQVEMWLDEEFPSQVPRLRWLTDIWHPNIQHDGAKGVCVNRHEWLAGMGLDDLCRQLFEMVQYKNYHADDAPPFPLDRSAATWVKSIAEPQGIVDKRRNLAVDNKPFTRPTVPSTITVVTPEAPVTPSRIRILPKAPAAPAAPSRIRLVAATPAPPAPAPSAPRIRLSQPVP